MRYYGKWETVLETVKREVKEETTIFLTKLSLFGVYSGKEGLTNYPNRDTVFSVQVIFHSTDDTGSAVMNNESLEIYFFPKNNLPLNLNPHQAPFIMVWKNGLEQPILK
ncbi:NUDIX domain-containing protein [Lysinibacillus odysseyi]|uniref:NUDIX domain-containing protein n=1 Tax=Lysinibacillus odysseyi TaxID=202611 RepID=UPI000AD98222|nr:NUDIX domain-containing protein [Lysinibacillus odysseyi]